MTILHLLWVFIPATITVLLTPVMIKYARAVGALDEPDERKVHQHPIPRLGGVAIFAGFFLSLVIFRYVDFDLGSAPFIGSGSVVLFTISLTLVLTLGIWDDIRSLSPGKKFLGQVLAASIVYAAGFRIDLITHPFAEGILELGFFSYPLTVLWIVGITNAFNLIDGLDGLAAGVGLIVSLTIFSISLIQGEVSNAFTALLLAGSIIGFLRYNFHNARIFLGDSGSLFIGFTLAILSMTGSTKGSTAFAIVVPMLALGFPIMDTTLSMIRRFLKSVLPVEGEKKKLRARLTSIFHPDRGHIHHRLIARGLSHRKVVLILYSISCVFGAGALMITLVNNIYGSLIVVSIAGATIIGISQLKYREMAILRNGLFLPLYDRPILNRVAFLAFIDLGFMIVSFLAALSLTSGLSDLDLQGSNLYNVLAILPLVQLTIFYLAGLYKTTVRTVDIGNLLKIAKSVFMAVIVTFIILSIHLGYHLLNLNLILFDFFFLISCVLGARWSLSILRYYSQSGVRNREGNILFYGTDSARLKMARRYMNGSDRRSIPLGYIDDNPALEGMDIDGLPVFGGHWKLERLVQTHKISEIIVLAEVIQPEVYRRIIKLCRRKNLSLKKMAVNIENYETQYENIQSIYSHPRQQNFEFS